MSELFNTTAFRLVEQGLSVTSQEQSVIAQNIANQDTPDYKCKYLYFAGVLRDIAEGQSAPAGATKRLELETAVYEDNNTKDQPDGNNVDADTQEALFVKSALKYQALINQMNSEFNIIRTAMSRS